MHTHRQSTHLPATLKAGHPFLLPIDSPAGSQSSMGVIPRPVLPCFLSEAAQATSCHPPENSMERQTGRTRPQILVVDDEEFNRDLIAAVLGEEYDLLIAGSGQEALDAAVRHLPDLILLDVMMPRMDGFDVCWRLKADAMTRNIVVVFISAIKDRGFETIGRELGAVDFITKPIMPASMRDRIQSQLQVKLIPAQVTQVAEMEETLQLEVLEALNVQNKDGKIH